MEITKRLSIENGPESEVIIILSVYEIFKRLSDTEKYDISEMLENDGYYDKNLLDFFEESDEHEQNRLIKYCNVNGYFDENEYQIENVLEKNFKHYVSKLMCNRHLLTNEEEEYLINLGKKI